MTVYPPARVTAWFNGLALSLGLSRCAIDKAIGGDRSELLLSYAPDCGWHALTYHPQRGSELFASPVRAALLPYGSH